jgi:hypothetical protein
MSMLALMLVQGAFALDLKLTPCPPSGSCVQRLLAIEGEVVPWPEIELLEARDLLQIQLEIVSGLVELRVDGRTLALADAEIPRTSTYVWYVPLQEGRDLQVEVISLYEGTSYFQVSLEAAP